jgi:hypothetical protein
MAVIRATLEQIRICLADIDSRLRQLEAVPPRRAA